MELRDFVSETLRQIVEGVVAVTPRAEELGAFIDPADNPVANQGKVYAPSVEVPGQGTRRRFIQVIEFDVGIVVTRESHAKGGVGVLTVVSVGGSKESGASQETTSRVKFAIPIALPLHLPPSIAAKRAQAQQHPPQPPAPPGSSPSNAPARP
jgi:hypothetical protein